MGSPRATRARMSLEETAVGVIAKNEMRSGAGSRARASRSSDSETPGRIATPSGTSSRTRSGSFQPRERRELVSAEEEDRVLRPALLERVDRSRVRVELDAGVRDIREREPRELEAGLGRRRRLLVAGIGDDEDEKRLEPVVLARRSRELDVADVRGIERAAEDPEARLRLGHSCHSSTSPSTSTSTPLRMPAARSASSSSAGGGVRPAIR